MTTERLLSYLVELDVKLWLDNGRLRYNAPQGVMTPELRAELVKHKTEIITFLRRVENTTDLVAPPMLPVSREDDLPLSFAQQRLWFLDQLEPDSTAYSLFSTHRLTGSLDVTALKWSLNEVVRRHEALRTTFAIVEGQQLVQIIAPVSRVSLPVIDLREWRGVQQETEIQRLVREEAQRPFDLAVGPLVRCALLRLDKKEHLLFLAMHHIVSDGWSMGIFAREVVALMQAYTAGRPSPLPELPFQYADFAMWQRQWLQGVVLETQLSYWQKQLEGMPTLLDLPTDRPRPAVQTYRGARQSFRLTAALLEALDALSQREGVTLYMTLLAAFKVLLSRYTGQEDIVVGSPIAYRTRREIEGLIGFFVNTLVMRTGLSGEVSFRELLGRVREVTLGAYAHQDLPFEMLVDELQPERDLSRSPLFQVMFVLQNAQNWPGETLTVPGLTWCPLEVESGTAQFDLTLSMMAVTEGLNGTIEYNTDLFDQATITRMMDHFRTVLAGIVADPGQSISALPLLTKSEQRQLLVEWNDTEEAYPQDRRIHELFEAQMNQAPDALALVFEDQHLTYRELNRRANRLAHYLQRLGVGPGALVGICLRRLPDMVVSVLGALKAGGAYVPLDPTYPVERLAFMLTDAEILVLLTEERLLKSLPDHSAKTLCLDGEWGDITPESERNLRGDILVDDLAYVIYTSGSTGKPKGVQISHRNVVNFMGSIRECPGLTHQDVLLSVTTLSFDIAGLELFLPLVVGASVWIVSRDEAADGAVLSSRIEESGATVLQATPAMWQVLVESGWKGSKRLRVLCGGEALPRGLASELVARTAAVWNMYGPTETTIWSSIHSVSEGDRSVPIGQPIGNTQFYVLDQRLNPAPVGVPGELHIGGLGVGRGYLGRAGLTAEWFIPDLFSGKAGARLYRTGDRVRYLPDGNIEFLGRMDHQVKVRGFRIELGEIEAVLAQHPAVQETVALVREDKAAAGQPSDKRLVAYVVVEVGEDDDQKPAVGEMRRFLKERLPEYMVPSLFVMLEALPLTPNGKVDRRALPAPAGDRPKLETAFTVPRTETERTITAIWQEVLGLEQVGDQSMIGIHDNFFDLGGHSLLMVKVRSKLEQILSSNLSMVDLFKYPTISSLAEHLSQGKDGQSLFLESDYQVKELVEGKNRLMALSGRFSGLEIAIIGMGGRFPGAKNLDEYWQNLSSGVESITLFSDEELVAWGIEPALLEDSNYVKARPVLEGVEYFDASFFGFTPREAEILDPQHRFFLECAWKTLEDAGYDAERYRDSIGLYAGVGMNTYMLNNLVSNRHLIKVDDIYQAFIGSDKDFLPTRTSYKLNLKGPSVAVQTACSTSLVAIHLACRGLLGGECRMALAGGVTVAVPQRVGYLYQEGGISSPDGHCRAFDAKARGTVFGSGVGIVVLKRLADAIVDGDCIHAVIKGSAINNDGSSKVGYTAPSVAGQSKVIRMAQIMAEVDAETIDYVETHGTGTSLGDPIEIEALTQAFRANTNRKGFCAIGSAKTNVGHLDAAAGVAGLIKTVLSLKHKQIAPSLHFEQPNPQIDFENSPFYVNTELREWKVRDGHPRRAGVSSFGIGGTNAHVILEEAPVLEPSGSSRSWQLLLLSAKTDTALETATTNLVDHLRQHPDLNLADVAHTLQVGRKAFDYRWIAVCQDLEEAVSVLETNSQTASVDVRTSGGWPVVFMFTGQGSQYVAMGLELYQSEPVFREAVDRCCELLEPHLGLELRKILYPSQDRVETAREQLEQTAMTQPALFVVEYALAQLWMSWGVKPAAMIGHSIGEYVAACLAGVLSLEDALSLVAARGRLMQQLPGGSMVAVFLPEEKVLPLLGEELALAAVNGPASCVISGPTEVIEVLEQRLQKQDVEYRRLHTLHAFHSAMMDSILEPFTEQVKRVQLNPPEIPYVSNVSGTWVTSAEVTEPGYWAQHLRQTVRFFEGIGELLRELECALLEVGPGKALTSLSQQHPGRKMGQTVVASLRHPKDKRPDQAFLMETLGRLWLAGVELDWEGFYAGEQRRRVSLPTYPFERQRYWIEPGKDREDQTNSLVKAPNITSWFYVPAWKSSVSPTREPHERGGCWLLFGDGEHLSTKLAQELRSEGNKVIMVLPGEQFVAQSNTYTIRPAHREDYEALLVVLGEGKQSPTHIVHLWNMASIDEGVADFTEKALQRSFYSLLFLAQAIGKQSSSDDLQLAVVSSDVQSVTGEETLCPEKAALLGLCKVIPQEYPHIACRSIDVTLPENGSRQELWLVEQLIAELETKTSHSIIAYRRGNRWVRIYEPAPLTEAKRMIRPRMRERGVYLITGGLGGIGLALAEYLAQTAQARLVLTSRSPFPEPEARERWLTTHHPQDHTSFRIQAIRELEARGAEILVVQANVTDRMQMEAAIQVACERFGPIHGVIHAAGLPGGGVIQLKTEQAAASVLAPKIQGTRVLEAVLRDIPLDFLVLCSSVTAITGGVGQADYCAANAFMDAFAYAHNGHDDSVVTSINWDTWGEVGMAVNTPPNYTTTRPGQPPQMTLVDHPLLISTYQETDGRVVYKMKLDPAEHWVLSEHIILDVPTIPGTTYLELACAVLREHTQVTQLEIREAMFLEPLMVSENDNKEAQFILEKRKNGFDFQVRSKAGTTANGEPLWQTHVVGQIACMANVTPQRYDIKAIQSRCNITEMTFTGEENCDSAEQFLKSGPRWRTLRHARVGHDEGIALINLSEEFLSDLVGFKLHPALLDVAVGLTIADGGPYLPLSYKRMRIYDSLPGRFYSYVRRKPGSTLGGETFTVQVTLIDEQGRCIVDIEEYTTKRVGDTAAARLRNPVDRELQPPAIDASYQGELSHALSIGEGIEAFRRILSGSQLPQIAVCTRHLPTLVQRTSAFMEEFMQTSLSLSESGPEALMVRHPRPNLRSAYVTPRNDVEEKLTAIWQQLLGIAKVGVLDDFFELGGHSLLVIQMISKVRETFDIDLSIDRFFETPIIADLAQVVIEEQIGDMAAVDEQVLDTILSKVEGLSEDELEQLLGEEIP